MSVLPCAGSSACRYSNCMRLRRGRRLLRRYVWAAGISCTIPRSARARICGRKCDLLLHFCRCASSESHGNTVNPVLTWSAICQSTNGEIFSNGFFQAFQFAGTLNTPSFERPFLCQDIMATIDLQQNMRHILGMTKKCLTTLHGTCVP